MIRRQNDILERCLERLAQGEAIEDCLADYPQQADELRPLLQAAQQLHSLSPQPPSAAADKRIEQRLRRAVRQRNQEIVMLWQRPFSMERIMKSFVRFIPRVALGVLTLGLLVFLIAQLPFWSAPEMEPMVSSTTIAVERESEDSVVADLSADPGEVPLYRIVAEPVPDTPEAMLAWARDFGLPEPVLYERPSSDDPGRYVIGSDGRRLVFQSAGSTGEIFYLNPLAATTGEPLPFAEASQIAVNFLQEHNLLPATYQVDAQPFTTSGNGQQNVVVRMTVDEGVVGELTGFGTALTVVVAADGQVAYAFLRDLAVETADSVQIISAQEAYDKLLAGDIYGASRNQIGAAGRTFTSPTSWQIGQTVDVTGYLELFVAVADGGVWAALSNGGSARFQLTGPRLAELAAENWSQTYRVQGVVTAQLNDSTWELEVQAWQQAFYEDVSCLMGELVRQDGEVRFRSDEGDEYGLPQAPAELEAGEKLQVCLSVPGEPGTDLAWSAIHVQPPSGWMFAGGGGGGFTMVQEGVVEQVMEGGVTRTVTMGGGGGGGEGTAVIVPPPSVSTANEASVVEAEAAYNLGDSVEVTGLVQAVRIMDETGATHLELQLINDNEQDGTAVFSSFFLLASPEQLEEMAAFVDLHIRVVGEIVAAPEVSFYMLSTGQAIAVESFDRPWPEERLENFLGHFMVEEIEGQQRMIFVDHVTNERYVVDPQYPVLEELHFDEEQGLLTAVVNPATEPIGGLPVLLNRGFATGTEIATAADLSQFPAPTENRIGIINGTFLRGNEMGENDVIERVELVYPYDPYNASTEGQPAEPIWVFYGRNAEATVYFSFSVKAVR